MLNNVPFTDYINDSIRILLIAEAFKEKKSIKLTDTKIKLYDYYLKFPKTMFEDADVGKNFNNNFDEYYAFFHWQPDVIRYRRNINFLIAKGLLERNLTDNTIQYSITESGILLLSQLQNPYKKRLASLTPLLVKNVSKLSDSKIELEIRIKTNIYKRALKEE
ncbi:MAG: ABC-three component system middle component 2 [Desulfitobacteriaceae bacterium]